MSEGVVYIAAGEEYISEAIVSAKSLKNEMESVPITIYSDQSIDSNVFDSVIIRDDFEYHPGDSIIQADMCPYDYNLYLDTDTRVSNNIQELFDVLDKFELGICFGSGRATVDGVPDSMPEYNTGVIAYRSSQNVKSFFKYWQRKYNREVDKSGNYRNQATFTKSLWENNINFIVLPQEYNVRVYPGRGAYLTRETKIIHGRHPSGLAKCESIANSKLGERLYCQDWYLGNSFTIIKQKTTIRNQLKKVMDQIINSVQQDGIGTTIKKIFQRLGEN